MPVMPRADALEASVRAASAGTLPPIEAWDPPWCGEMDLTIAADGTWWHAGTPIARPELVRLFSTILRLDGDRHVLVTPAEKLGIIVEDAPFVAVDVEEREGDLVFTTNVGDRVSAGPDHPIRMDERPYVMVRRGLEARIDRKSFYRLVDLGEVRDHDGAEWFGVTSGVAFFPLVPAAELDG